MNGSLHGLLDTRRVFYFFHKLLDCWMSTNRGEDADVAAATEVLEQMQNRLVRARFKSFLLFFCPYERICGFFPDAMERHCCLNDSWPIQLL